MTDDLRTTLTMPADMAAAVDEFWHTQRLSSRNAAIRELLRVALNQKLHEKYQPAKEPRR